MRHNVESKHQRRFRHDTDKRQFARLTFQEPVTNQAVAGIMSLLWRILFGRFLPALLLTMRMTAASLIMSMPKRRPFCERRSTGVLFSSVLVSFAANATLFRQRVNSRMSQKRQRSPHRKQNCADQLQDEGIPKSTIPEFRTVISRSSTPNLYESQTQNLRIPQNVNATLVH